MSLDQLTVLIITWNEEANIARTLASVAWAQHVLVIDSFSTDGTMAKLKKYRNVQALQRKFVNFADQCNYGLSQITTPWVLSLDADYLIPEGAETKISAALCSGGEAFKAEFEYCVHGRPVRGGILPPRTVLYKVATATYVNDGHGHRVIFDGIVATLQFRIRHDDRKPLSRWLQSQVAYARQDAEAIISSDLADLSSNDRIRRLIVVAPWLVFFLVYIIRGGILSGWRGLFYALQRLTAELLLSMFMIDLRISNREVE